jgi:hypothetical protein
MRVSAYGPLIDTCVMNDSVWYLCSHCKAKVTSLVMNSKRTGLLNHLTSCVEEIKDDAVKAAHAACLKNLKAGKTWDGGAKPSKPSKPSKRKRKRDGSHPGLVFLSSLFVSKVALCETTPPQPEPPSKRSRLLQNPDGGTSAHEFPDPQTPSASAVPIPSGRLLPDTLTPIPGEAAFPSSLPLPSLEPSPALLFPFHSDV